MTQLGSAAQLGIESRSPESQTLGHLPHFLVTRLCTCLAIVLFSAAFTDGGTDALREGMTQ